MSKEKLCTVKQKILALHAKVNEKIFQQFGFHCQDVSLDKIVNYLYTPKDSSSLAVTRILFGIAMLFDIAGERGGATMVERWGNPSTCHFALLPFIRAVPMPYMALVYAALWLGAVGIALGYKYRVCAAVFTLCYWYLFLVEKSFWNNHSYLFGLVATLLTFTDAHCYWSIDAVTDPAVKKEVVPYWNYFILKYQFFILYFMAGVKKGTAEWLTGYSVQNLSEHWVFNPIKLFLTAAQTDYLVVHWFVFVFDLTVAFWMMWGRTRHFAMLVCALFHLMNSRLFSIGMFPWVCLATMPLFYPFDWPKTVAKSFKIFCLNIRNEVCNSIRILLKLKCNSQMKKNNVNQITEEVMGSVKQNKDNVNDEDNVKAQNIKKDEINCAFENMDDHNKSKTSRVEANKDTEMLKPSDDTHYNLQEPRNGKDETNKKTVALIFFLILTQAFLPFSHFITQGYNNWTNGLYGYSWDMMVHTWDTNSVVIKIVDNEKNTDFYIDPYLYAPNDRWTRHGDMLRQYAHCIKDNILLQSRGYGRNSKDILSNNLSIYVDVWCSMNGRFTQRMFDPKQDLLKVSWSPFEPMSYLMPLLDEALSWRSALQDVRQEVHSWHNASDVLFIADFPGYDQQKYIPTDLSNVTLTILEGKILYEPEVSQTLDGQSFILTAGNQIKLNNGMFHKVFNVGETPAYYMYTFVNTSDPKITEPIATKLPIARELSRQLYNMFIFVNIVVTNIFQILVQFTQCPYI